MNMVRIGDSVARDEDLRLLQGKGRYLDDVTAANQAYAQVLRSPFAHAEIRAIDTSAAASAPGVLTILTGKELEDRGLGALKPADAGKRSDGSPGFGCALPLLAQGRVRFVGQAVAFIVAESAAEARDAAELIEVQYSPLPAVVSADAALADGAPVIWEEAGNNEAFLFKQGDEAGVEAIFSRAAHVVRHRICVSRVAGNPMENRGCIGEYDSFEDRYRLRATVQSVHGMRGMIASQIFRMPHNKLQVICDNMGGGFGTRGGCQPEYSLVLWASEVVGRPVKWVATREEGLLSDEQARGTLADTQLALDENFRFLAIRADVKVPIGAYYATDRNMRSVTGGFGGMAGVYGFEKIYCTVQGALTNTMTNAQYRGGAKPEPVYYLENIIDVAARDLGVDPAELRRINTIPNDQIPYTTCLGDEYDCGDFLGNFEDCLKAGDYAGADERRREAESRGKILGVGMSNSITGVASTNFEHVEVRFDPSGGIVLQSGAMDHGQGHDTTFRQVLADRLGIDHTGIKYRFGDTDKIATGVGTFNARCAVFVGSAVHNAAEKIIEKGKKIAAHMLEAASDDIEFGSGMFKVAGTDRQVSLTDVAKTAFNKSKLPPEIEPGLYEHGEFGMGQGQRPTYPNGCHLAEVEIDKETGEVEIVRYTAVDDAGTILNPILFDGQVHGGIVQGAGQILMENVNYDPESGQLLSGSFMDYCMPRAGDFCDFNIAANEVPTGRNPLGVKGVGESGTVGALPAVMNAVNDALHRAGAPTVEMPATPQLVWKALHQN
ncbi:MAG: xanthine dehydrogenase family protein molybdopterin-binding subunit [Rhodospirillaceae bacterium]|jgi:carbon-monoxide dehydrogenase large subunit